MVWFCMSLGLDGIAAVTVYVLVNHYSNVFFAVYWEIEVGRLLSAVKF